MAVSLEAVQGSACLLSMRSMHAIWRQAGRAVHQSRPRLTRRCLSTNATVRGGAVRVVLQQWGVLLQ